MRDEIKMVMALLSIMATTLFVTLKLTDTIDWSWWLVLSPAWLPLLTSVVLATLAVMMTLVAFLIHMLGTVIEHKWRKGRKD